MTEKDQSRKSSTTLTLGAKREIIEQMEIETKSSRKLASEHGVCKTTIGNIIKNKERILESCTINPNRKRQVDTSRNEQLNKMVYDVVVLCRQENIQITGALLQAKARMIAQQLSINNFAASSGWLERFKKRYNVSFGERNYGYVDDVEPSRKIQKFISDKLEEDQEQKANTMIWQTPDDLCEFLDETEVADNNLRLLKTEDRSNDFHDIDTALSTMLISCSINFDAIDSPYFKKFVAALNPSYALPSSKKLKDRVISKLESPDVHDEDY